MSTTKTFLFILLYYIVWFACIFGGAHNYPYIALVLSIVISGIQSLFFTDKKNRHCVAIWLVFMALTGFCVDSLWTQTGILIFKSNPWQSVAAAPWILALWINFAVLCYGIHELLEKLFKLLPVIALFGFPLAYLGGVKLGAAIPGHSALTTSLFIGGLWSILFPTLIYALKKIISKEIKG